MFLSLCRQSALKIRVPLPCSLLQVANLETTKCIKQENSRNPNTKACSSNTMQLYQRPVRGEPGKVVLGFVPFEWVTFFTPKTGATGLYTFFTCIGTFLVSKEIFIMEHNFYNGLSVLIMWIVACNKWGSQVARQIDAKLDEYEGAWVKTRTDVAKVHEDGIRNEMENQKSFEGQLLLVEAKRENVRLQLEAEYRRRLMQVYTAVTNRLDYQIRRMLVENSFVQKSIVAFVVNRVHASLTPEFLDKYMDKCIDDLEVLVKNVKL